MGTYLSSNNSQSKCSYTSVVDSLFRLAPPSKNIKIEIRSALLPNNTQRYIRYKILQKSPKFWSQLFACVRIKNFENRSVCAKVMTKRSVFAMFCGQRKLSGRCQALSLAPPDPGTSKVEYAPQLLRSNAPRRIRYMIST